jgi:hypothetical protein
MHAGHKYLAHDGPMHGFRMRGHLLIAVGLLGTTCGGRTPLATLPMGPESRDAGHLTPGAGELLPPTPGRVRCGASVCDRGYECCLRSGEGTPASIGCDWRSNAGCDGWPRTCDETADCGPGELCCWFLSYMPPSTWASICHNAGAGVVATSCPIGESIGCASDTDCTALGAPACVAQRCRGEVIQTCGLLPDLSCGPL